MTSQDTQQHQSDQPKQNQQAHTNPPEALEQAQPAEPSGEFGPDTDVPSNYEANQVGVKKSLSGFEVNKAIGRL